MSHTMNNDKERTDRYYMVHPQHYASHPHYPHFHPPENNRGSRSVINSSSHIINGNMGRTPSGRHEYHLRREESVRQLPDENVPPPPPPPQHHFQQPRGFYSGATHHSAAVRHNPEVPQPRSGATKRLYDGTVSSTSSTTLSLSSSSFSSSASSTCWSSASSVTSALSASSFSSASVAPDQHRRRRMRLERLSCHEAGGCLEPGGCLAGAVDTSFYNPPLLRKESGGVASPAFRNTHYFAGGRHSMNQCMEVNELKQLQLPQTPQPPAHVEETRMVAVEQHPQSEASTSYLDVLPDSVLAKILYDGYLDTMSIVSKSSLVSKRWFNVAKETVTKLDLRRCSRLRPCDVTMLVKRYTNLTHLDFNYCHQFSNDHLQCLLPVSRKLRSLCMRGTLVNDHGIHDYFWNMAEGSHSEDCDDASSGQCVLEEVDLSATNKAGSKRIGRESVDILVKNCPKLQTLLLGWCSRVDNAAAHRISSLCNLSELDLSLCSLTTDACYSLSKIKSLRSLDISATRISERGLRILATDNKGGVIAPPLSRSLFHGRQGEGDIEARRCLQQTKGCGMEIINARFLDRISVDTLEILAMHVPNLQTLDITHCRETEFVSPSMRAILRHMKRNGTVIIKDQRR
mmetsp:Transcript_24462/g.36469  ORF Transcript_24462/g.36469 Transcript_24462/m.36469 type:complete len:628 (+) Transcript_24462:132-2015(+)